MIGHLVVHAQAVYVDSNTGDDNNEGTKESPFYSIQKAVDIINRNGNDFYIIKINPGIYILKNHVTINTKKNTTDNRIVIEASILPDDPSWTPEEMPVIISTAKKGEIQGAYNFVISFLVDESHVTIKGLKFPGYFYPNTRYFPIARINMGTEESDLIVEQCMFIGDEHASAIQVGVIADGNEINVNHNIFYNARNAVVFWRDMGSGIKTGNSFTNNVTIGAYQTAVWTAWPDNDFLFKNNIITDCRYAWIKNYDNSSIYSLDSCVIVNNQYYQGVAYDSGVVPKEFEINENNVIKEGEISLRKIDNIDDPLPVDYLHIIPDSLGYDLRAGIFKNR